MRSRSAIILTLILATALLVTGWRVFLRPANQASSNHIVHLAVASNFSAAAHELADLFTQSTNYEIILSTGSTGKLYAQIINGAPYDIFLAADAVRPTLLESNGLGNPGTRFTYAQGRLVLWSPQPNLIDQNGTVLQSDQFNFLALANPDLAPYGYAAREFLEQRGLWQTLQPRIVRGENINQALQYVQSGNAQLGFVAAAQLATSSTQANIPVGSRWIVPADLHSPIAQQAIQLRTTIPAQAFLDFLRSPEALDIIRNHGYDLPS